MEGFIKKKILFKLKVGVDSVEGEGEAEGEEY